MDEQGPKYRFYSFFLHAKYLVSWSRVAFATVSSFVVAYTLYGAAMATYLIVAVMAMAFFSGRYAGEYLMLHRCHLTFVDSQQSLIFVNLIFPDYLLGGVMGDYLGAVSS